MGPNELCLSKFCNNKPNSIFSSQKTDRTIPNRVPFGWLKWRYAFLHYLDQIFLFKKKKKKKEKKKIMEEKMERTKKNKKKEQKKEW